MISGLVAYLTSDTQVAEAALLEISQQPAFELGTQNGLKLPMVLETATSSESQTLTDWLRDLSGVEHVDVAFVHLDESPLPEESAASSTEHINLENTVSGM